MWKNVIELKDVEINVTKKTNFLLEIKTEKGRFYITTRPTFL